MKWVKWMDLIQIILIIHMRQSQKKKKTICQIHNFSLKPTHKECYFTKIITCSFCRTQETNHKEKCKKKSKNNSIEYPAYNNDRNYATPTFILSSEKKYFEENANKLKLQHERKVYQYTDQKTQMWAPKPRSKHNFCSVCNSNYQDYLSHIVSLNHSKKIHSSTFNKHIADLVQNINKNNLKSPKSSPKQIVQKQYDDIQISNYGLPRKIQKMQPKTQSIYKSGSQSYINYPPHNQIFLPWNLNNQLPPTTQSYQQHIPLYYPFHPYAYNPYFTTIPIPQLQYFNPINYYPTKSSYIVIDDDE